MPLDVQIADVRAGKHVVKSFCRAWSSWVAGNTPLSRWTTSERVVGSPARGPRRRCGR